MLFVKFSQILFIFILAFKLSPWFIFVVFFLLGEYPTSCFKIETNVSGPLSVPSSGYNLLYPDNFCSFLLYLLYPDDGTDSGPETLVSILKQDAG
jgi:hypothetical protein